MALALSCSSRHNGSQGNPVQQQTQPAGKVIPEIRCQKDPSVTYALYLPPDYSAKKRYPLMLVFDPHASGALPLGKYKALAEKYGYILIGSNDSKNGQNQSQTAGIVQVLFNEIPQYNVDTNRIYTMGFSGGGRVAGLVGLYRGGVAGIITCGAGLPGTTEQARFRPDFIGIAGLGDFNMFELMKLDGGLEKSGFHHALVLFDGIHAWPPEEIMENAFLWSDFCAMKESRIPKNDKLISDYISGKTAILDDLDKKGSILKEYDLLKTMINFLDGLVPVDGLRNRLADLEKRQDVKKQLADREARMNNELKQQQEYANDMFVKELGWWKKEITNYGLRITNSKKPGDSLPAKRMMSYLSLLAYMSSTRALAQMDTMSAAYALTVYEWVDPDNPEVYYLKALLAAKEFRNKDVLPLLKKAMDKGFKDADRVSSQMEFESVRKEPGYELLLQEMSGKIDIE
jgi:predicted esterase